MQNADAKATRAVLQAELDAGEVLQWAGRPCATTLAIQQLPKLAFMIVWVGLVVFMSHKELISKEPSMAAIVLVLFLVIGVFFLWSATVSLMAAWHTFYGITDRRLLVLELGMRRRITSWTPKQITSVERRDRNDGRGDVTFHRSHKSSGENTELVSAALVDVAEVRIVEDHVRRLAAS